MVQPEKQYYAWEIDLSRDTLVTIQQTSCGSGIPTGDPSKFGLPHNVVLYLNGGHGYTNDINGLFSLGNDILGGVSTDVTPEEIQKAIATMNMAFEGCRILSGYISYVSPVIAKAVQYQAPNEQMQLACFRIPQSLCREVHPPDNDPGKWPGNH